jgi:hypothetical protein
MMPEQRGMGVGIHQLLEILSVDYNLNTMRQKNHKLRIDSYSPKLNSIFFVNYDIVRTAETTE